jgi:hypothetical protein
LRSATLVHICSRGFCGLSVVRSPFPQAIGKVRWINDAPSQAVRIRQAPY